MSRSLPRRAAAADAERRSEVIARRAEVALAGFGGDEATVRAGLVDPTAAVRVGALYALVRLDAATPKDTARALRDEDPAVRIATCEIAPRLPGAKYRPLLGDEPAVAEAAAFALGEVGDRGAVPALVAMAQTHDDPLCREAAVAALGAIGDRRAKGAVLAALEDVPAVRRRAVVALAAFEGADVDAALRSRLEDKDWQVRQAAEDVLGAGAEEP